MAMSEFQGFSDREIKSVQQRQLEKGKRIAVKASDFTKHLQQHQQREALRHHQTQNIKKDVIYPPQTKNKEHLPSTAVPDSNPRFREIEGERKVEKEPQHLSPTNPDTEESTLESEETNLPNLHMDSIIGAEKGLELLQQQQKQLEEENKKKKALLEQTIRERYARSQEEAKKLQAVKNELARLDNILNKDVAILRLKIEESDRHYAAARKRYDAAETEYVAAKLALHKTAETKELLSEHLCTIIQQNEVRKSEKLAELTRTLELEGEDMSTATPTPPSISEQVLLQKTPTPGLNIWPHGLKNSKDITPTCNIVDDESSNGRTRDEPTTTSDSSKCQNDNNTPLIKL